ncbi:helix-turn-helix transcriptional regulator [Flavobacterium sp. K5-23]|uniref:helix-turn-helix domain-containing protein n=1 Tax=Flavobacterium sp. K5-23 TaxID=2746225 RepID=UPI00200F6BAD|nr:helix-turn-helix transcriptional regulator [Flavobacterium sp. K5-23]UQD57097.1 helix-turn-helix transcriptional regulator [Flavobacterium sp. K5-23]
MENKNTKKFLDLVSNKESGWLEKAKWRQENEDWLDISFSIAVKILSALKSNKKADIFPRNQKELSEAMECSAQYINKLLKGKENLQIETICKIQRILKINLIEVPKVEIKNTIFYEVFNTLTNKIELSHWSTQNSLSYQNNEFEKANINQEHSQLQVA